MSNTKKKKKMEDRISQLPDSLLHHILSTVNTELVVQTCVLSKRWKTLWIHIPTLNFDFSTYRFKGGRGLKRRSFKHFIFRVLLKHGCMHMQKLNYADNTQEVAIVELLICYAGSRNVQQLCIDVGYDDTNMKSCDWTYYYSACSSLTTLTMTCGFGYDWGSLMLPSLKILEIDCGCEDAYYPDESFQVIKTFSGCPNLESLVFIDFHLESVTICAPKLKNLELCLLLDLNIVIFPEVELHTPILKDVHFINVLPSVKSTFEFPHMEKVNIVVDETGFARGIEAQTRTQKLAASVFELLRVFHNARSFTLPLKEMQAVSSLPPCLSGTTFHNLKHLKLKTQMTDNVKLIDLPICVLALKCPNIDTLGILNEGNKSRVLTGHR